MTGIIRQILVVVAVFVMVYLNVTSGASGFTEPEQVTTEQYYLYATSVSPTPLTFLIWAPIFIGIMAYAIYQALPRNRYDERFDKLAVPIIAVCIFNAAINYVPIGLSVINVLLLLGSLAWTFVTILSLPSDRLFYTLVRIPIAIFFGWITVATIVNTSQWLVSIGWSGLGISESIWSVILLFVATTIGFFITLKYREIAFGGVLIWAYMGILVSNASQISIVLAVILYSIVIASAIGWILRRSNHDLQKASIA